MPIVDLLSHKVEEMKASMDQRVKKFRKGSSGAERKKISQLARRKKTTYGVENIQLKGVL